MKLIFDAHLDIAWNAMSYDRDQTLTIAQIRTREKHMQGKGRPRGRNTVSLPEMHRANVGLCLATILSRALPLDPPTADPGLGEIAVRRHGPVIYRDNLDFANQTIASATAQGQLAYYKLLEHQGAMRMLRNKQDLHSAHKQALENQNTPVGYILSMEGADPIIAPDHAYWWWDQGLRTACLAHYGPSRYAMGTGGDGPLTQMGRRLLQVFEQLGMVLDLVHTADRAVAEALDIFHGPVFVSHGNARALVPHDRQISDEQLRQLASRDGVTGIVINNWMLKAHWREEGGDPDSVTLENVADHIDHICQLLGNCRHVGIGSDLDGGFGTEETPQEIYTIADLHKLEDVLHGRGYSDDDMNAIFSENFMRFFRDALPD